MSEEKKRILGMLEEIDEKRSQLQPAVLKQRGEVNTSHHICFKNNVLS